MFYNSCFILLNVFNVEKHIPKIESGSLPRKGDLYLYNPTKITDPSNDIWSTIHKVDTAWFKYLAVKKICLLYAGVHLNQRY